MCTGIDALLYTQPHCYIRSHIVIYTATLLYTQPHCYIHSLFRNRSKNCICIETDTSLFSLPSNMHWLHSVDTCLFCPCVLSYHFFKCFSCGLSWLQVSDTLVRNCLQCDGSAYLFDWSHLQSFSLCKLWTCVIAVSLYL